MSPRSKGWRASDAIVALEGLPDLHMALFAESTAKALSEALGKPVTATFTKRYQDSRPFWGVCCGDNKGTARN